MPVVVVGFVAEPVPAYELVVLFIVDVMREVSQVGWGCAWCMGRVSAGCGGKNAWYEMVKRSRDGGFYAGLATPCFDDCLRVVRLIRSIPRGEDVIVKCHHCRSNRAVNDVTGMTVTCRLRWSRLRFPSLCFALNAHIHIQ